MVGGPGLSIHIGGGFLFVSWLKRDIHGLGWLYCVDVFVNVNISYIISCSLLIQKNLSLNRSAGTSIGRDSLIKNLFDF